MRVQSITLRNFLSYRHAKVDFEDLLAVVGPNAAGKTNLVSAIRLLGEIPLFGLQTALARRGGFDQLRHRSEGRPYDPSIRLDFKTRDDLPSSFYELELGAKAGKTYYVKSETARVHSPRGVATFAHSRGVLSKLHTYRGDPEFADDELPRVPAGQTAINAVFPFGGIEVWQLFGSLQTVEINPARIAELQTPTPPETFEPDGSNTASFFESLPMETRTEVVDQLAAIVPGITKIEPHHVSDKLTLRFFQTVAGKTRQFEAKHMSAGTLRAFGILLSLAQPRPPALLVIEEPEIAIHLGALRTMVEILREYSSDTQILITTHSADIVDALDLDELRVVWSEDGQSRVARIAEHTRDPIRRGLITPGELLRSNALDPDRDSAA